MKASELQTILKAWNDKSFSVLEERLGITRTASYPESGAVTYAMPDGAPCHCGHATGLDRFPEELKHPQSNESLAVGAILDRATNVAGEDLDLDVVILVGINYTQFDAKAKHVVIPPDWRDTVMWRSLGLALQDLDSKCFKGDIACRYPVDLTQLPIVTPKPFHLVAVNYFPWITRSEWGAIGLNSIAESLALRCWGYPNPSGHIAELISKLSVKSPGDCALVGNVPFVVFHGAQNAVPYLALETMRALSPTHYTNYIFTDNLSRSWKTINAVVCHPLTPLILSHLNVHQVNDE